MGRCAVVSACQAVWFEPRGGASRGRREARASFRAWHLALWRSWRGGVLTESACKIEGRSRVHERRGRLEVSAALASIEVILNRSGNGVVRDCSGLMGHVSRLGQRQVRSLQVECFWSPGCAARAGDVDNLRSNVVARGLLRGSVMGERHNTALQLAGTRVERGGSLPCASPGQRLGRSQGFDELTPPQLNASRYGDRESSYVWQCSRMAGA